MIAALELVSVIVNLQGARVLDELSLAVMQGETLVLVGRSGSGKTTVLRTVLGLVRPSNGLVRIGGVVASEGERVVLAPENRKLAVVFQDLALWPHMTVEANVAFALEAQGVSRSEREPRVLQMLTKMELANKGRRFPRELSGGEKQRVALARALIVDPIAILLDEPLASLDPILKREIRALLRGAFADRGATALYVTHDLEEARVLSHRVAVVDGGRIVQIAPWSELCDQPANDFVRQLVGA